MGMAEKSTMVTCIYAKVLAQLRKTYWQKIFSRVLKELEFTYICRNYRCCECDETFAGEFLDRSSNVLFEYRASNNADTVTHIRYTYPVSILMRTSTGCYCGNCIGKYYEYDTEVFCESCGYPGDKLCDACTACPGCEGGYGDVCDDCYYQDFRFLYRWC